MTVVADRVKHALLQLSRFAYFFCLDAYVRSTSVGASRRSDLAQSGALRAERERRLHESVALEVHHEDTTRALVDCIHAPCRVVAGNTDAAIDSPQNQGFSAVRRHRVTLPKFQSGTRLIGEILPDSTRN